ncbi:alpha-N-acetylglucosaminidase [Phycisphaerales bacterium AB-hyl4]|uniref:Alpha-N-acetylglucosaminidase n=1 Tax=Natronomicrosphaera hydrolytica TaxID=3242702 RepID=A0ABV4U3C3_9BACT
MSQPNPTADAPLSLLALTRRLLGDYAANVRFESSTEVGAHAFEWEPAANDIVIRGRTGVDQARGLFDYLRESADACLTWEGDRLTLPPRTPRPGVRRGETALPYRHYLNQVTFAYSTAWWDWPRWEREIDWMALQGINAPLMAVGQESVWQETWRAFGVSETDLARYWTGPGYLPFHRMGCIDTHAGPLPRRWIDRQAKLATKILTRMRDYGMTPVLPAFAGHVPEALRHIRADANITQLQPWAGFEGTWFLDAADPMFHDIQRTFLANLVNQFGTDHLYAADPFIETAPTTSDPTALSELARGMLQSMTEVDADAQWVLQTWPFSYMKEHWGPEQVQGFLAGIPRDHLLLLDLYCDVTELWRTFDAFHGKRWLWCAVDNFGGRGGSIAYGRMDSLVQRFHDAKQDPVRGELAGMGIVWEAIEENAVIADLFMDGTWEAEPTDLSQWLTNWAHRRYGQPHSDAVAAWQLLRKTVYAAPRSLETTPYPALCTRPDLVGARPLDDWYDPADLIAAVSHLLAAAPAVGDEALYRHDLVRITLRALMRVGDEQVARLRDRLSASDAAGVQQQGEAVLALIAAAERLAATQPTLLLGRWIASAQQWGDTSAERDALAHNARQQVTTWGGPILTDYACKPWAGLFQPFYAERWKRYIDAARRACDANQPLDLARLAEQLAEWDNAWLQQNHTPPADPVGDPLAVVREIHQTFLQPAHSAFAGTKE